MFFGLGIGTKNTKDEWLEVYYPFIENDPEIIPSELSKVVSAETGFLELTAKNLNKIKNIFQSVGANSLNKARWLLNQSEKSKRPLVLYYSEEDGPLRSVPEAYFKLHCISKRLFLPNQLNLDGIFPFLPNVAWTNAGAVDIRDLPDLTIQYRLEGKYLLVESVDKFPKMADYVVPSGVRIANTARVRLGAYVGEGTTIMHEGFINFNAGTEGKSMVEGRISSKVFVGEGSDLGGGCSTMGTLSGGGNAIISVGKNCLLGANSGLGISFGDRCTLEAGLYLTAGAKVRILDTEGKEAKVSKAKELSGKDDLLFRRNSETGAIECLTNRSAIQLNEELHAHN